VVSAEQWAGAEAQIAMLLRQLSSNPSFALSAIVLGQGKLATELKQCGIETALIPSASGRFLNCLREASRFLRQKKVDVLHSHKSKENLLALLLAKRFGIPFLVRTKHGMPEPRTSKDRIVYGLERLTARFANRVICVSGDLKQTLARELPRKQLAVVHNAIDFAKVHSEFTVAEAKRKLGISTAQQVVGIVGRIEAVKRVDLFLEVAHLISRELPSACFVIAGSGREETALRNSLQGSDLEQWSRFLGERDDIYDVLRAMDLLLITSDHEGLPTVLLEAMALGVPVLARNVGGIGEVICNGMNGVLINSANAAELAAASLSLLTSNALRNELIAGGLKTVTQFSAEHNAALYIDIYHSLVSMK